MLWASHRLYLADHLWLIGHDEKSGKSRVSETVMGLGLAGCLLGELAFHKKIDLTPDHDVKVLRPESGPERLHNTAPEQVANTLLQQIISEQTRPQGVTNVRDWLAYTSQFAHAWVVDRLLTIDLVEPYEIRPLVRKKTRYRVINSNDTVRHAVQIVGQLRERGPIAHEENAFLAFCDAAGLNRWLLRDDDTPAMRNNLQRQLSLLQWPLSSLVAETKAAIGDAVLAHRT